MCFSVICLYCSVHELLFQQSICHFLASKSMEEPEHHHANRFTLMKEVGIASCTISGHDTFAVCVRFNLAHDDQVHIRCGELHTGETNFLHIIF